MKFTLPELPYSVEALAPHVSAETLRLHHGAHHKTYVDTTNRLLAESPQWADADLDTLVRRAEGKLFDNAAQHWNHSFYWKCLTPQTAAPGAGLASELSRHFGSVDQFKSAFTAAAQGLFGSGWTWLVRDRGGALRIVASSNAGNPLRDGQQPLLTCDVWEHAYYVDYRNKRADYLQHFWAICNWSFMDDNLRAGASTAASVEMK